ncbi:MAG TPA: 3-deoxy-D-manno-octulosonic acid transferase [Pyrinomonadaceae bacterium]|jgi:3-deoxy-D-manno-octulosonic-acid transferase|nr:3-deoxy-D-manno-octulosonic acid transferase [Pyrinomonadaceae bacterium]
MYFLYSILLTVGFIVLLPRFVFDAVRHGKYAAGFGERMGRTPQPDASLTRGRPVIWLHCVSVGETQAARPLVSALGEHYPSHALVVSTTTRTGQTLARELFAQEAAAVFYFPFDWAWTVRRALRIVRPSAVLVLETELWPRFLRECNAARVPVALVNGRISDASFRRYRMIRPFIKRVVNQLTLAIMQTDADAARIRELGLAPARVRVSGNIKFDAQDETSEQSATTGLLRARFALDGARPLIVAASTHAPEERIVLAAFQKLRRAQPHRQARLLIAPRHPERFDEIASLLDASGLSWSRRSAQPDERDAQSDCILLDSIGELRGAYALATLVFIGGSIARTGGHNVLEPASHAKCIVTGAHTSNFASIVRAFLEQDALVQLPTLTDADAPDALARVFEDLLADDVRRQHIGANAHAALARSRGATARTLEMLGEVLNRTPANNARRVAVKTQAMSRSSQ